MGRVAKDVQNQQMKTLLFATQNQHKATEINALLGTDFKVMSLTAYGWEAELQETGNTLEENALQKARQVYAGSGLDCFADDTGLEVEALQGAPGVYSARYAGPERNDTQNIKLLLSRLQGESNRNARFRTVIALIYEGKEYLFEGEVLGEILTEPRGEKGFGYDPVFKPLHSILSFAEMELQQKNNISHRARAFQQMKNFFSGT